MNSNLVWYDKSKTSNRTSSKRAEEALKHYVNIGKNLKNNQTIVKLKRQLKSLPPVYKSIRPFLVYNVPTFSGKTQSGYAISATEDLLPFHIEPHIHYSDQGISSSSRMASNAVMGALRLDKETILFDTKKSWSAFDILNALPHKQLYLLGLFKEMISLAIRYKNMDPKPSISWPEYFNLSGNVNINPISIEEFRALFPLDIEQQYGSLSSKLLDYVIIMDQLPMFIPDNEDFKYSNEIFFQGMFLVDFARAIGFSVLVLGSSNSIWNSFNVNVPFLINGNNGTSLHLDLEQMHWCTLFTEATKVDIPSMISEFGWSQYFKSPTDLNSFNCEVLRRKGVEKSVKFIFKLIETCSPGVGEIMIFHLVDLIKNSNEFKDEESFWNAFRRGVVSSLICKKSLGFGFGEKASVNLLANVNTSLLKDEEDLAPCFVQYHLYSLQPEVNSFDYKIGGDVSSVKLYYPDQECKKLRYLHHDGTLKPYEPKVRVPDPEKDFFTFLASQIICWWIENNAGPEIIVKNELKSGGTLLSTGCREYFHYERFCVASVCRASSVDEKSVASGVDFVNQLLAQFMFSFGNKFTISEENCRLLANTGIYEHDDIQSSLQAFRIPCLGVCDKPWSDDITASLAGLMDLGNLTRRRDGENCFIEFDLQRKDRFIEKGGVLIVNFGSKAVLNCNDVMAHLKDPSISRCQLVMIASSSLRFIEPKGSYYKITKSLESFIQRERVNIFVIGVDYKSYSKYHFETDERSKVTKNMFSDPSRIVFIIDGLKSE